MTQDLENRLLTYIDTKKAALREELATLPPEEIAASFKRGQLIAYLDILAFILLDGRGY